MSTSANVITILRNGEEDSHFRKKVLTKFPLYSDLLKYQHEIVAWGYDEEEELWEDKSENLEKFLKRIKVV
jgi:hypothetical protein